MLLVALSSIFLVGSVNAEGAFYTNRRGVEMTESEYNRVRSLYSESKTSVLTQEEFDNYISSEVVSSETYYEKSTYKGDMLIKSERISEEEYNNVPTTDNVITPYSDNYQELETQYKRFVTQFITSTPEMQVIATVHWKKPPVFRSYDLFGMRFQFFDYTKVYGEQLYFVGENFSTITYDRSSPGFNPFYTGFGFSMNLKDGSNITEYDLTISATINVQVNVTSTKAHAYVSYQHAQADLTREQSMKYTMDIAGLGNVFYFTDPIGDYYDDMNGLHLIWHL